jgi:hypothetical protein
MSISMHSASAPVLQRMLGNLLQWLDKAEAHARSRGWDANLWLGERLAPDMLPLSRQVQIASDTAKGCMARLAGLDVPRWDDNEATLEDLRGRVRRTLAFIEGVPAAQVDGSDLREITLPMRSGDALRFTGEAYLKQFALPNFFFHVTTTYALLRAGGVEIGKADYLGR